jgi:rRNA-processing protein FCF1
MACVRQGIDFFDDISYQGYEVLIPENVIRELKKIIDSKQKLHHREAAELSLKILRKNKYRTIKFEKRNVDNAIAEFANSRDDVIVATLDRELKKKLEKNKMVIRDKKKLEVV